MTAWTPAPDGYTGTVPGWPETTPVPRERWDWDWSGSEWRRRPLVRLTLRTKGTTCHLCGLPGATTADHVIPRSHGGRNALDNLEPAHMGCNAARGNRTLSEWFARRPLRAPALTPSRKW